jgi:surfactin synthase thioesterase subunit
MNPLTLICFPHAGADAGTYRKLANAVSNQDDGRGLVRVEIVNLPGRGRRGNEALLTNLDAIIDDALSQITSWITGSRPVFFGHSMGAWLAYLGAQRLWAQGRQAPSQLIVSGAKPPRLGIRKSMHELDQAALIAELETMGGFPKALLSDTEALEYFLPILRADMEALATYKPRPGAQLNIPITVFRGTHDTVSREEALAWREESSQVSKLHEFDGNHFFVTDQASEVARVIRKILFTPTTTVPARELEFCQI